MFWNFYFHDLLSVLVVQHKKKTLSNGKCRSIRIGLLLFFCAQWFRTFSIVISHTWSIGREIFRLEKLFYTMVKGKHRKLQWVSGLKNSFSMDYDHNNKYILLFIHRVLFHFTKYVPKNNNNLVLLYLKFFNKIGNLKLYLNSTESLTFYHLKNTQI